MLIRKEKFCDVLLFLLESFMNDTNSYRATFRNMHTSLRKTVSHKSVKVKVWECITTDERQVMSSQGKRFLNRHAIVKWQRQIRQQRRRIGKEFPVYTMRFHRGMFVL